MLGTNTELLLGMVQVKLRSHGASASQIIVAANFVILAAFRMMQSLNTAAPHGFVDLSLRVMIVGSSLAHVSEPGRSCRALSMILLRYRSGWSESSMHEIVSELKKFVSFERD